MLKFLKLLPDITRVASYLICLTSDDSVCLATCNPSMPDLHDAAYSSPNGEAHQHIYQRF